MYSSIRCWSRARSADVPLQIDKICLPPGTYRGAILMRHNGADGVNTDFELPVTLVLTP